ncbi:MAG: hypothetical protein U9O06_11375 [Euryarchaeota archaeon]|nr:hypothetical protein [Euryarchaeota archaeon]
MSYAPSLSGTVHRLPFAGGSLAARIAPIYRAALETVGGDPRDILVLKRLPNKVPEFTAELRDVVGLESRPNVKSVARHASTLLEEAAPQLTRLTYEQRIEFLAAVLQGRNWSKYYDRAQQHDSFGSDVGQLLLDATWQGGFDTDAMGDSRYDDLLRELAEVNRAFHDKLAERDLVEQASMVPRAVEALEDQTLRTEIEREFDLVIAVEFEEYSAVERAYIGSLTANAELVCVAEQEASIERTAREAGGLDRFTDDLEVIDHTDDASAETPATDSRTSETRAGTPYAEFLATGSVSTVAATPARIIAAETLDRQVQEVANEIEFLRHEHDWAYDDCAVLLRAVGDPMPRVRRLLQQSGVPTASAGVNGLEQDLAVRELHALAQYYADGDDQALGLIEARVPDLDTRVIEDCVDPTSIATTLKQWIVTTGLKGRIARESDDIDAREQFRNLSRLLSIAEFVDTQDFLSNDWFDFITMLERAITYDAPYAHTAEVTVAEGGVTVGDVSLLKNDSRKAVFLINVVDSVYPGEERLTRLFPTAWLKQMSGYPAVTQPTAADVTETYATASKPIGDPFEAYHNHRARRQLAVGARAADSRLYFCRYRTTRAGVGKPHHQSRYLSAIQDHPELPTKTIEGAGKDRDIYTLGSASTEILAQPWAQLESIQAIASQGGSIDIQEAEANFAEIQELIETNETVSDRFVQAIDTQFDMARGAIAPTGPERRGRSDPGATDGSEGEKSE